MQARPYAALAVMYVAALVAACSQKEPKTVAYYNANPAERDRLVAECKNNPGKLKDDPDCINANDSVIQQWGKAKLPPVNFSTKPAAASGTAPSK